MMKSLQDALVHLRRHTLRERFEWRRRKLRLALWRSLAGKQQVKFKIQDGVRMWLYPDSHLSRLIYCDGYESSERQFLKYFLRPGDVFIDVGANIGLFTVLAGRYVGAKGAVHAFEPCAKSYQRLLANVELNQLTNVFSYETALSDCSGHLDMTVSLDGFDECNSFARPLFGKELASERVASITWDEFVDEKDITGRVTMIKIDVEGWEGNVLAGGARFFAREDAPMLLIEFNDPTVAAAGTSSQALYRALESLGYKMFIYDAKARTIVPDPLRDSYPWMNLIAAKRPDYVIARLKGNAR